LNGAFIWQARVYWEDTDAGGIVYHASYLRFLERARTEWLRAHGVAQRRLASEAGVVFSVVTLQIQYQRPARLDDLLLIDCEPQRIGGASFGFTQRIWREGQEHEPVASAQLRVACLDARSLRPKRLPQPIAELIAATSAN
jgi:acyl-CoA thioester hydrolase